MNTIKVSTRSAYGQTYVDVIDDKQRESLRLYKPNKPNHTMTYKTYTEDLADFGYREQKEAQDLFEAWKTNGLPIDFENNGVKVAFNMNSGYVFLTNSEYQVAMCETNEQDQLELYSFYTSPYEGKEGSFDELLEEYKDMHFEDQEWFQQVAENINRSDELPELDEE